MVAGFGVIGFEFFATAFPTMTGRVTASLQQKLGTSQRVLASFHQPKPRSRVAPVSSRSSSNIVQQGPENPSEETRGAVGVLSVDNEEDLTEQRPTSLFPAMESPTTGSVVPGPSDSSMPGLSGSGMMDPSSTRYDLLPSFYPSICPSFPLSIHHFPHRSFFLFILFVHSPV